jgi:Anti-sigma-K factor rskA
VPHVDPEQLALIALGEPIEPDEVAVHLAECDTCQDEVASLRQTVAIARDVPALPDGSAAGPPMRVWAGIAAELGLAPTAGHGRTEPGRGEPGRTEPGRGESGRGESGRTEPGRGEPGSDGRAGRPLPEPGEPRGELVPVGAGGPEVRRRWLRPVVALVAAAAIGAGVTVVGLHPWTAPAANPVVSAASLAPLPTGPRDVTGSVTIRSGPGGPTMTVDARGLPLREGYYEVWLFDPDANKMVAVGDLGSTSSGEYHLPPTLNLRAYHVVDISAEDYDGDQTHSADSVLRGTLTN